jgi:hypothetical protein
VNTFIRFTTILVVIFGAVAAGWAVYAHGYHLALSHHQGHDLSVIYPGTIEGLVYSSSMVLLDHARRGLRPPVLAKWVLATGISATLAANLWFGWRFGVSTALISMWPAPALFGSYEMLLTIIRGPKERPEEQALAGPETVAEPASTKRVFAGVGAPDRPAPVASQPAVAKPTTSHRQRARHAPGAPTIEAAQREFAAEIARGEIPSLRDIKKRLRIGDEKAPSYRDHIAEMGRAVREAA